MAAPAPHFDRLIRALHRRLVLLRTAERVGACLLIGSGGAALLMPLIWWRGGAALPLVLFSLGLACGIGLLMATLRQPTKLDAAMEADRQLKLHDLLGTALVTDPQSDDPWAVTVFALADARCRDLSPSKVLLHRWGSRAWGAVGLAISLLLTLALFTNRSTPTQAATELFANPDNLGVPRTTQPSIAYSPTRSTTLRRPSDPNDDTSAETGSGQTTDTTTADKSASASAALANGHPPTTGDPTGSGAGASGTSRPPSALPTLPNAASQSKTDGHAPTATGGQADNSSDGGSGGSPAKSGVTGGHRTLPPTPPWSNPTWSADKDRAIDRMRSASTYDPYRDLIRAYFERQ